MTRPCPALFVLVGLLAGCSSEAPRVDDDDVAPDDDDLVFDDDDATPPPFCSGCDGLPDDMPCGVWDLRGDPPTYSIFTSEDPWHGKGCTMSTDPRCFEEYLEFIVRAQEHACPIGEQELIRSIYGVADLEPAPPPVKRHALADGIVDALNIRFLLDGLDERPLQVIHFRRSFEDGFWTERFILRDPWVGEILGQAIHPAPPDEAEGPWPAVLAVHGHGTGGDDWADVYHGLDMVEAGAMLFVLDNRMMYADQGETDVNTALMLEGFTLLGLHVYEVLVLHKYMRWRQDVDHRRIGLIGHSAGANKGNQLIRITDAFAAYVSDTETDVIELGPDDAWSVHEALVPALEPYEELINDFATARTPVLVQPYGFGDGPAEILAFWEEQLRTGCR